MKTFFRLLHYALCALLLSVSCAAIAQGNSHHDRIPPGQAKKMGDSDRAMAPGQAKKYFRDEYRNHFYAYYRGDTDGWRGRKRPAFVPGQVINREYVVRPVPRAYWVNVAPTPPPGYAYGYYGGYVVMYNPATRIVADVLDLLDAARSN